MDQTQMINEARAQLLNAIDAREASGELTKGPGIATINSVMFNRLCNVVYKTFTNKTDEECMSMTVSAIPAYYASLNKDWKGIPTLADRIVSRYLKKGGVQVIRKQPEPEPMPKVVEPPKEPTARIMKGYRTIMYNGKPYTCTPEYEAVKALIAMNEDLYLWGPAGTGKTMMVEVAAWELGMDFYIQTAPQEEYQLLGKEFADGTYEPSPFVLGYKSERPAVILLDEPDRSWPAVLIQLNSALANGYISLPNNEMVYRAKDVTIVCCANTSGQGASSAYGTAQQLDASTLDRFSFMHIDYDEEVELACTGNDQELLSFLHDFKKISYELKLGAPLLSYRGISKTSQFIKTLGLERALELRVLKDMTRDNIRKLSHTLKGMGRDDQYTKALDKIVMDMMMEEY